MLQSYLAMAMRQLLRHKLYTAINIVGLFVASAVLALVVAVLTVAAVAKRAARAKPVATLRYE